MMSAYEGMVAILDINETVEKLKNRNRGGNQPDFELCEATRLLVSYRNFLVDVMKDVVIIGGK